MTRGTHLCRECVIESVALVEPPLPLLPVAGVGEGASTANDRSHLIRCAASYGGVARMVVPARRRQARRHTTVRSDETASGADADVVLTQPHAASHDRASFPCREAPARGPARVMVAPASGRRSLISREFVVGPSSQIPDFGILAARPRWRPSSSSTTRTRREQGW